MLGDYFIILFLQATVALTEADPAQTASDPDAPVQKIFCEGEQAVLECGSGKKIAIRLANYGRFTLSLCNPLHKTDLSTTCQNDRTLMILKMRCDGHQQCSVPVNNDLGDPCPDTEKYLDIEYECTEKTAETATTSTTFSTRTTQYLTSSTTTTSTSATTASPSSTSTDATLPKSLGYNEKQYCDAVVERDVDWPTSEPGTIARASCPIGSTGFAEWACEANGLWSTDGPDLSHCMNTWSKDLLLDAEEAEDSLDQLEYLREIQQRTRREPLLGGDLIALSRAITLLIPSKIYGNDADDFIELVVESVNNMARETQASAWNDLKGAKRRKVADVLMSNVDQVSTAVSALITPDTPRIIMKPNIEVELEISDVRVHDYVTFPSMSLYRATYDTVDVPREALTLRNNTNDHAKVLYVSYSSMAEHLETGLRQNDDGSMVPQRIASKIVSASMINQDNKIQSIGQLHKPVIITFLMELSTGHNLTLTFITYFGCTLSIICLLLSLFAFQCFGTSGGDRIFIHKNLCFSLLVAEAVFLGGIWQTSNPFCCSIIAGVLHYFFLAAFAWMLLEGFELYYMLVEVFQSKDSKKPFLLLFGYGFPAAVVAVSIWFDRLSYGTERYCWLRSDNYFILAFVGPVAFILLCNTVFLVMTLFIVCSHSSVGYTPCKQDRDALKNVRSWLKGSIALVALLGVTWTFGLMWINEQSIFMAYAFTILNSLQGLFIFLFHVAFNDRMHKDYRKWVKHTSWAPDCMRDDSSRTSRAMPYLPTSSTAKTGQAMSSSSSTGSELLYPSMSEKYPVQPRIVAAVDPRYNNSVQMLLTRQRHNQNGVYDYATIGYDDLRTGPFSSTPNYYHQPQQQYYFDCIPPVTFVPSSAPADTLSPHFRPPPSFPPPPPPPASILVGNSPTPISTATTVRLSDDSAFSDSSASPLQYHGDVVASKSGMLLRMDLSKNPPVFVQGI